ncbi:MAG: hypothetical protein WCP91_00330 [Candidatus Berkelbacteria bacterium]
MEKQSEKVTKEDFIAYKEVQFSGVTNMFDVEVVSKLSGLSRDKIINIMKNYSVYTKQWS